jgi:glycosyltransferase involved in cell wall biosynthesis
MKQGGIFFAGVRAMRVLRQFRPTIVHLHTEIPESTYAMTVALPPRHAGRSIVRTIHNSDYWNFSPRLGRWCERRMTRSFVACVSQDAQAAFVAHRERSLLDPLPVPSTVIYNGVTVPGSSGALRPSRSGGPIRILFAGRFEKEKGADLLPTAIRQTRPPPNGAELVLHGHGSLGSALQSLAATPPRGWTIHVRPPIADLCARMAEYDLVIIPSRVEGLSLVAIEAMMMGVPVIGTDAPGLREALPPDHRWRSHAGDAIGFAAQLESAMNEPQRWREVATHAEAFARQRFDYGAMLTAYTRLYHRAIANAAT